MYGEMVGEEWDGMGWNTRCSFNRSRESKKVEIKRGVDRRGVNRMAGTTRVSTLADSRENRGIISRFNRFARYCELTRNSDLSFR